MQHCTRARAVYAHYYDGIEASLGSSLDQIPIRKAAKTLISEMVRLRIEGILVCGIDLSIRNTGRTVV